MLESGRPIGQVAKDLAVGSQSLRTWVRQMRTDVGAPGAPTSKQPEELRRLRSEDRELCKTVDTPKAASVFSRASRRDPRK